MPGQSEGAIVDVYEDHVDIRAIEFKGADDADYVTRYLPIAQYRLYTAPEAGGSSGGGGSEDDGYVYLTSSMVSENPHKETGVVFSVDDNTHNLQLTFNAISQGILITDGNITTSSTCRIYFDSITFSDGSTNPLKIGFYGTDQQYHITSGDANMDVTASGIQFNTSSHYTGTLPITVTLTNVKFTVN